MQTTLLEIARAAQAPVRSAGVRGADPAFQLYCLRWIFDARYYDVSKVRREERELLFAKRPREGAVLYVPPSDREPLTIFPNPEAMKSRIPKPRGLAVAGVGSSALGAAALARNVADALGGPAAAVVAGEGRKDVVREALGGAFWFAPRNYLRSLSDLNPFWIWASAAAHVWSEPLVARGEDVLTAAALLDDPHFAWEAVIGHSKGNFVLSEAFRALGGRGEGLAADAAIVTFSAAAHIEPPHEPVHVMGMFDPLGWAFSPRLFEVLRWEFPDQHSTNTQFGLRGVDVTTLLREVMEERRSASGRSYGEGSRPPRSLAFY